MIITNPKKNCCLLLFLLLLQTQSIRAQESALNKNKDIKDRMAVIQQSGTDCIKKQQFGQAVILFNAGLQISRAALSDSFTCSNLFYLGMAYRYKSDFDSSLQYLHNARLIADKNSYSILQALIQIESYGIYNRLGKADSAAVIISRLKEMLPKLDSNSKETARIEMYLGHDDKHKAKYTDALAHYYKALRTFNHLKDSLNEGNIYISLANVLVYLGEPDKALNYHQQAAAIFTQMGRRYELANELINITDMYYTSGRLDSAESSVKRALLIGQDLNEKVVQAYSYMDLGNIYKLRKNYQPAEGYFLQAIKLAETKGMDNVVFESYQGLGEMYMASQQPAKAAPYLEKNLLLAKQNMDKEEIIEASWNLAQNENALQHYDKAFNYLKQYSAYKDSAYNESTSKSMAEMDAKYQAEKKEKEIVLLKKDQQLNQLSLQKQKNFQVGAIVFVALLLLIGFLLINRNRVVQRTKQQLAMEKMRNNIARDLHDDIGSTLTSINILSKVALQQQADGNVQAGDNMQKIKDRSSAIMESMGDIVWAINPQNDTVEQMLSRMKEFAAEMLEPLNIQYSFKEEGDFLAIKLDVEKRKDLYLLFKEAVNNAAKYSHCNNLVIRLIQDSQSLQLSVVDDGTGFNEQEVKTGNGLRNMRERAAAMEAGIQIDSSPGKGTGILVKVPIT